MSSGELVLNNRKLQHLLPGSEPSAATSSEEATPACERPLISATSNPEIGTNDIALTLFSEASRRNPKNEILRYIAIEIPEPPDDACQSAVRFAKRWRRYVRSGKFESGADSLNEGYEPQLLAIGRDVPDWARQELLDLGVSLFDLDQPSNRKFKSAEALVRYIHRLSREGASEPRPAAEPAHAKRKADKKVDADISEYYKPLAPDETLKQYLDLINQPPVRD